VKETLIDNPLATATVVNEAWTAAGMEGTISETLVNKMRAKMGLSGNLRGQGRKKNESAMTKRTRSGRKRAGSRKPLSDQRAEVRTGGTRTVRRSARLAELEADLDQLLFKVMSFRNLPEVEAGLRQTRRALYRSFATKR
jgi:hypothetical protein